MYIYECSMYAHTIMCILFKIRRKQDAQNDNDSNCFLKLILITGGREARRER